MTGSGSITLNGTVHDGDGVAEQAQADLVTAYDDAAARPVTGMIASNEDCHAAGTTTTIDLEATSGSGNGNGVSPTDAGTTDQIQEVPRGSVAAGVGPATAATSGSWVLFAGIVMLLVVGGATGVGKLRPTDAQLRRQPRGLR